MWPVPIPRSTRCNLLGKLRPRTSHGRKPIRWPERREATALFAERRQSQSEFCENYDRVHAMLLAMQIGQSHESAA